MSIYRELTHEARQGSRYFSQFALEPVPWCLRMVPILEEILREDNVIVDGDAPELTGAIRKFREGYPDTTPASNAIANEVVHRDRRCRLWHPYQPGNNPEKHLEEWRFDQIQKANDQARRRDKFVEVGLGIAALVLACTQLLTCTPDSFIGRRVPSEWFGPTPAPVVATVVPGEELPGP